MREKAILNEKGQYVALKTFDGGPKLILKGEPVTITSKGLASEMVAKGFITSAKLELKQAAKPAPKTEPAKPKAPRARKPRKK
jgi:hypothetical protein